MTGRKEHAVLPESYVEPTLDAMNIGDAVYTVPWAMWVDLDRRCWLNPKYTAHQTPGGTVCMRVERRKDGYHVWLPKEARYDPHGNSPADNRWLPVTELHEETQR